MQCAQQVSKGREYCCESLQHLVALLAGRVRPCGIAPRLSEGFERGERSF